MKILIISQYFWPETFRINDLALDLINRGHEVTVITGNPNYPQGKFYAGYSFKYKTEYYKGIKIYRVPILPRGINSFTLFFNYLSFALSGSFFAFFHKQTYDKIFAVNFSPITAVYPAVVYKIRHKIQLYLWVQDLWPESVSAASNINSKIVMYCLNVMVKHIYKHSDKILVQSEAFIPALEKKGVSKNQIRYVPNWAEDLYSNPANILKEKFQGLMPNGFKVMFAGNIGKAQDFESIMKAAYLTRDILEIKWIIVGDGRKKNWVEDEIIRLNLHKTVFLLGRFSLEDMPNFFIHADIMLLSLKDVDIFSITIPTKIQSYMASGKPIIGMLNGIGAKVIRDADCGYACNANDYNSLADIVINASHQKTNFLIQKGENGKQYYNQHFSKQVIIDNLIKIFQE